MSDFYEKYWQERRKSGSRPRYRIFFGWIVPETSVLDIGCGDGYFGEMLVRDKRVKYQGGDISEEGLKIARARGLNVIKLNAEIDLPKFESGSFDYVIMSEFIEHVVNSEQIILEALRIARRGVLLSIPNVAYWKYRLQLLGGRFPKQWEFAPHEHLRFWSIKDFQYMAEALGVNIKGFKASNGKPILRDIWPNLFGFQICFFLQK